MDEVERQQIIEQNLNYIVIIMWGALLFFMLMADKLQFFWEVSVIIIFVRLMWKTGINIYRMKNPIITSTPHEKPYHLEVLILRLKYFKLKQTILIVLLMLSLTGVGLHNSNSDFFHSRYLECLPRKFSSTFE